MPASLIFIDRIACHGHKTSNIVECGNGVFVDARWLAPYRFNDEVLGWCGEKLKERVDKIIKWIEKGHILTPYCHELFQQQVLKSLCPLLCLIKSAQTCAHCAQVELAKRSGYAVVSGDGAGKLFYVQNMQKADAEQIQRIQQKARRWVSQAGGAAPQPPGLLNPNFYKN